MTKIEKKSHDVSKLKGVYFPDKRLWRYPRNDFQYQKLIKSIPKGTHYELIKVGGKRVKQVKK